MAVAPSLSEIVSSVLIEWTKLRHRTLTAQNKSTPCHCKLTNAIYKMQSCRWWSCTYQILCNVHSHNHSTHEGKMKPPCIHINFKGLHILWSNTEGTFQAKAAGEHFERGPQGSRLLLSFLYRYLTRSQTMTARITMATTDRSRHVHEQPPLVRLFRIASLFCTRWTKENFVSVFHCKLEKSE
jgi:hypothetical protein